MQKISNYLFKCFLSCYDEHMNEKGKINLFGYLDYRQFLRDQYELLKKSRAGFSLRLFSQRAGFTSSNLLKLVMDGDRNLTDKSAEKFCKGLQLNKQETEFFSILVKFNQATTHDEKNRHYKKLLQFKNFSFVKPMQKEQYEYYSKWYHAVVRELITSKHYLGNAEQLASVIHPQVSIKEIEKSISLLEKLGFIKKEEAQKYTLCQSVVTTGPEVKSVVLMNYHKDFLNLTHNQIENVPSELRDISTLTLGIEKSMISEIKKRIQNFRNEILQLVSTQNDAEDVVILAMQLLPVTKNNGK